MQSANTNQSSRCIHRSQQRIGQANCKCDTPNQPVYSCKLLDFVCIQDSVEVISIEVNGEIVSKKNLLVCEKCIYVNSRVSNK